MPTFYDTSILMKHLKLNGITIKKHAFSQHIQTVPIIKLFYFKIDTFKAYKPRQGLYLHTMYQTVPLNEINVPIGTL